MPRSKQQPVVNPDFVKPIIVAGIFLIVCVVINGTFNLANTKMLNPSSLADSKSETSLVSTKLMEVRAKLQVDAREVWQSTSLFVEKGVTVHVKVLGGKWTEWKGVREYNLGDGSGYICANSMKAENCAEPIPDFSSGALIGRIDRQVLKIGADGKFKANQSGILQLRMNDVDAGLYDNHGVLTVLVVLSNK